MRGPIGFLLAGLNRPNTNRQEKAMEQGPDELGERPDDRAEELTEQTDKPMDEDSKESGEDAEGKQG
jgi:hypothetical protein